MNRCLRILKITLNNTLFYEFYGISLFIFVYTELKKAMDYTYKIYQDHKFLIVKINHGIKDAKRLLEIGRKVLETEGFIDVHYTLMDYRGVEINFTSEAFINFAKLFEDYKHIDNQQRIVYLIDNPKSTVAIHLYIKKLGARREYCSTIEKAYSLLKLDVSFDEFENLVNI